MAPSTTRTLSHLGAFFMDTKTNLYDTIVFDCDSTLVTIEGADELAKKNGVYKKVTELTQRAMNGQLDFNTVFKERWDLIKPTIRDLEWLGEQYINNITLGAKEMVAECMERGIEVFIISGGIKQPCDILGEYLGLPKENVLALNLLFNENGNYIGIQPGQTLLEDNGKARIINKLFNKERTLFVGDGCTDLSVEAFVETFVGFGGNVCRKEVESNAKFYVHSNDLLTILKFI